jgi:SAM-dependent methyltransferase
MFRETMRFPSMPQQTMLVDESALTQRVAEYWNARPCNIRHSTLDPSTPEYSDEVEARKYAVEPHISAFADFPRWAGKRVLEIGTGIGTDTLNFARHGAEVVSVDLSSRSVEVCRQRLAAKGQTATLVCGNAERLRELLREHGVEGDFDLVYSFGVIHHADRPEQIVSEARSLLRADGELRMMLYSKWSFKLFDFMGPRETWDFARADEIIQKYAEAQVDCPRALTYTFDEIRELLTGFDIQEMRKAHIFTYDVDEYIQGRMVVRPAFSNMTSAQLASMESELGWHTLVRATVI